LIGASAFVAAATEAAARAEAAALVLAGASAGAWFSSEDDPALLALPPGSRALVGTPDKGFHSVELADGALTKRTPVLSDTTARRDGLNLWDFAKGDGKTDDTAAINRAFALAVSLGVRQINCGGADRTYLLGGPFVLYGTFDAPEGPVPFNRYKIRLYSDLEIVGQGARFQLAGGAIYPGGIFGQPFWHGERLRNVALRGLVLDGNMAAQIVPPIPANTHDNSVWQHGNAISGCFDGLQVSDCVFRDIRGHGINLNWASTTPEQWAQPQHIEVHHNEFVNIFTQACNAGAFDTHFHHNKVHGDGFWVGGFDIESGHPAFAIRSVRAHDNVYDFREGVAPAEAAPQFASNSAAAAASRRRLRRAVTAFCPPAAGGVWTGTMDDVLITDETIYQGTISFYRFGGVKIRDSSITNMVAEDVSGYVSSSANAISISAQDARGIAGCEVTGVRINSVMAGQGIYAHGIEDLVIRDNELRGMASAAVRLEGCSGHVDRLKATDFGSDDSGYPADAIGSNSSAVVIYGGQSKPLLIGNVRAKDTRSGKARRARHVIYANVAATPVTRITDCTGRGLIGEAIRDVNGTTARTPDAPTHGAIAATFDRSFVERERS
jgi:hypothetical protein